MTVQNGIGLSLLKLCGTLKAPQVNLAVMTKNENKDSESNGDLKNSADSFVTGIFGMLSAIWYFLKWLGTEYRDAHPIIQLAIGILITPILIEVLSTFSAAFHAMFWSKLVLINRDVLIQILPIPVGMSIYLLFLLWFLSSMSAYAEVSSLRQRVNELENK